MWKELTNLWKSDNLLVEAWEESFAMLEIAQEMFLEAIRILRESDDTVVNQEIRRKDKKVNEYERNVRRKVMTHCTLQGPTVLPSGMALVSIVIDIERIGDYCKNILDLAEVHPQHLSVPAYEESLAGIEEEIKERFNETINGLKNQDVEKASTMMRTFKEEISAVCDQIDDELVKGTVGEISSGDSAALALYARYLKRISAHLNNMISSVVNPFDRIGFREGDS
jgi:Na+/phosphate symporter|tara:strand:- start:1330 stop:2004 length:675 start_codon:yes stop_codon:yes gene_type:complete